MSSVSPDLTRTARTSPLSLHITNRWSPRVTSCTSPSRSVNASRTNDEIAEIMLPTTSRSLSLIRLRDMCLTRRPFAPMTKTSSMIGSGGAVWTGGLGGVGGSVEDGMRLTVTCICLGVIFLEGKRCQRSEEAHASAKPAPKTRTHPSPGVVERARVPVGLLPEDRKSTRLNSSHVANSYAVFCLK